MATAFAATSKVDHGNLGPRLKIKTYSLQMPSVWTAAGQAWDLSADFDEVFGMALGASGAVGDWTFGQFNLIGTAGTYGHTASTIKIVCHQTGNGNGVVFTSAANSEDFSDMDDLSVVIFGYEA